MWEDVCQPTVTSVIFSFIIIYFLTKDVIQNYYLSFHKNINVSKVSLLIHIEPICLLSLLYHYIFFKHSLCIAIHLSIFSLFHYIINVCNCYMLIHLSIFLLYHYILINTKCHITDSCIIISPLSLYIHPFYLTITIQI